MVGCYRFSSPKVLKFYFWLTEERFIFEMKQDIITSQLEESFLLSFFNIIKVFVTFLESVKTQMTTIFSNSTKN